ncbi:hypothetical protein, partial [Vandammella animalimorsus]|uniref:hypothetical protein n=1 Tax=Vandammella animalimorsus TaxID=2029117 RepID=UPI001EEDEA1B
MSTVTQGRASSAAVAASANFPVLFLSILWKEAGRALVTADCAGFERPGQDMRPAAHLLFLSRQEK